MISLINWFQMPFTWGIKDRTVNLTVYFHLVLRLRIWYALPQNPICVHRVVLKQIAV